MKSIIFLSMILSASYSNADLHDDVALIRRLAPADYDLAQVQSRTVFGEPESLESGQLNYLLRDLNSDGKVDLMVILEKNPTISDDSGQPCSTVDYDKGCYPAFGERLWNVYYGQSDGSFKLNISNSKVVLTVDEGGVWGDPLQGLSVRKTGAVLLSFYGGSAWRWAYQYTVQFRKDDIYVIGQYEYSGWTADLRADTKDVNLVTGKVIETHTKGEGYPIHSKTYKIKVSPLVKLRDFEI